MKNIRLFVWVILALLSGACVPQEETPAVQHEQRLTAVITSETGTKTTLSGEIDSVRKVLWTEDDQIGVYVDNNPNVNLFRLVEGAGTKQAVFSGTGQGAGYTAVYPYEMITGLVGEDVSIELPAEQSYQEGSFQSGVCPMVAVSATTELPFRNLASILKLSMTGHHTVTGLVFRSNDKTVKVTGPATVVLSDPGNPVLQMSAKGCDSLVFHTDGVMINDEEPTDFFLVLPPQLYKGGFTVRVYTTTGYMDKKLETDFRMERSQVHAAKTFAVKLDEGVEPSVVLSGNGTPTDPFRIASLGDLLLMQSAVNTEGGVIRSASGNTAEAQNACYLLTTDLDMSPLCSSRTGNSWVPIGDGRSNEKFVFSGLFDGGGHTVSGLYINSERGYQGFFGYLEGTIRNLTVEGNLTGGDYCGIVASRSWKYNASIDNCTSRGYLQGGSYLAGIISYGCEAVITSCRNEARIEGRYFQAGIAAYTDFCKIINCSNQGSQDGEFYVGGIVGDMNGSRLLNCINSGDIHSDDGEYVGGLTAYMWQGSKVVNCINTGEVSGTGANVGGLCGFVSSYASYYNGPSLVANSVNTGMVKAQGSTAGILAGYYGLDDWQTSSEEEPETNAWVKNCYWLSEGQTLENAIGSGTGISESNFPLTAAQIRGTASYDGVLYIDSDGSAYSVLLDALNAGAVDWKTLARQSVGHGGDDSEFNLTAWSYGDSVSYPSPTDLPAQKPGSGQTVFFLSGTDSEFNVAGGEIRVSVTANMEYSVTYPEWVVLQDVQTMANQAHTRVHNFSVTPNTTGLAREGAIVFTNIEGKTLQVRVSQKAPYLVIQNTTVIFSGAGGTKSVEVTSSLSWKVSTDVDWLSFSQKSGEGDGAVSIRAAGNPAATAREASVTLSSEDGTIEYRIPVIQSANEGEETDEWKELPFYHQSVAMRFTATWCGWCPSMSASVAWAQERYPGKIQHLALHGTDSDLEFGPTGTLMRQFHTNSFPTGVVDGRVLISNSADPEIDGPKFITATKETEETYGTASGMGIRSYSAGRRATVDIDAYFKEAGDYKITVLLVEDGIIHEQASGGSDYRHDNVVRATATNILGDAFTVQSAPVKRGFSYTVSIPSECKNENLRIFAYIQKSFGSAPRIQNGDFGDYYIDNCATSPLGETLSVALVGGSGGGGSGSGGGNEELIPGNEIK